MPQGPKLTEEVRRIIAGVYLDHKDWVAKQVMDEVHRRLRKSNPKTPKGWPGLSSVQAELKRMRARYQEVLEEGQDAPWTLHSLDRYPIPPEAMPDVLAVRAFVCFVLKLPFTIRDAKWASRLHAVLTRDLQELAIRTVDYAAEELQREIAGVSSLEYDDVFDEWDILSLSLILDLDDAHSGLHGLLEQRIGALVDEYNDKQPRFLDAVVKDKRWRRLEGKYVHDYEY